MSTEINNFYQEQIQKIENYIDKNQIKEAIDFIQKELDFVYIPPEIEIQLQTLLQKCKLIQVDEKSFKEVTDTDITHNLQGNYEQKLAAIQYLKQRNVRMYLDEICQCLQQEQNRLIRSLLIVLLIEQEISTPIYVFEQGMEVEFIPCYVELPNESSVIQGMKQYLHDFFDSIDPQFVNACIQVIDMEALLHLPFAIEEDEMEPCIVAVVKYVSEFFVNKKEIQTILKEKKLAQLGSFELLLNTLELSI